MKNLGPPILALHVIDLWLVRFLHEMTSCNANISGALDKRIHGYLPYAKTAFVTATNAW